MYQLYRDRPLWVWCIALANIFLSIWCIYLDSVINFDGVTYIAIAQMFADGNISAAAGYYSWPFYSIFIALVSKVLWIDVELAAYTLNTLLVISLSLAFVCIVREISGNHWRITLIAIIVILLLPSISKYRSFIIRDFGYLSCYLWSLYFIFRYCASGHTRHLTGWLIFAAISSLFRFEGVVFILIAPYFLFLFSPQTIPHRKKILSILSLVLVGAAAGLLYWYINDKYMDSVEVAILSGQNIHGLWDFFIDNLKDSVGEQDVTVLSFFGLLGRNSAEVFYELVRRMAVFYFLFAAYTYFKKLTLHNDLQRRIWQVFLFTNLLMLLSFSVFNNFFVSRYTMASALTLLILAPFAINHIFDYFQQAQLKLKLASGFAIVVLLLASLEGLNVTTNKYFVKQAGVWMNQNLPKDATIYSNNKLAIYYADRGVSANLDELYSLPLMQLFMQTNEIKTFDYVALVGKSGNYFDDLMRQTLWFRFKPPIKIFHGDNGEFVFIHRTQRIKRKFSEKT